MLVLKNFIIDTIENALSCGERAFLIEGEPGVGKTTLGFDLFGEKTLFAQMNQWANDESIIRGVNLAGFVEKDPAKVYAAGALVKGAEAAKSAGGLFCLILDEWDKTKPAADSLLFAALQERRVVDAAGNEFAKIPDNMIFWVTSNGTRKISDALLRRVLRIKIPPLSGEDLIRFLVGKGTGLNLARTLSAIGDDARAAGSPIALTEIIRLAQLAPKMTSAEATRWLVGGVLHDTLPRRPRPGDDVWAAVRRDKKQEETPLESAFKKAMEKW